MNIIALVLVLTTNFVTPTTTAVADVTATEPVAIIQVAGSAGILG